MDVIIWILIIGGVILFLVARGRKPPRPRGGSAGQETVGGIDLPTWVAMEENLDDK